MCISFPLKQSYMEVRTEELSKSGAVFNLLPSWFVYHTLLCQVIPHAVWFGLIFKSLTLPGSGEHCQKYIFNSERIETLRHSHPLSATCSP